MVKTYSKLVFSCLNESVYNVSGGSPKAMCVQKSKIDSISSDCRVFASMWAVAPWSCWMTSWVGGTPSLPCSACPDLTGSLYNFYAAFFLNADILDIKLAQCYVCCHIFTRRIKYREVHSWRSMMCLRHLIFYTPLFTLVFAVR